MDNVIISALAQKGNIPEWYIKLALGIKLREYTLETFKEGYIARASCQHGEEDDIALLFAMVKVCDDIEELEDLEGVLINEDHLYQPVLDAISKKLNELYLKKLDHTSDIEGVAKIFFDSPDNSEAETKTLQKLLPMFSDFEEMEKFYDAAISDEFERFINPLVSKWLILCRFSEQAKVIYWTIEANKGGNKIIFNAIINVWDELTAAELSEADDYETMKIVIENMRDGSKNEKTAYEKILSVCVEPEKALALRSLTEMGSVYDMAIIKKAAELMQNL